MNTIRACIFLLFLIGSTSSGFSDQQKLDTERRSKLEGVVAAIQRSDGDDLKSILSDGRQALTSQEANSIFKEISKRWGNLSKLVKINEENLTRDKLVKGDMHILAHWGSQPTQVGRWITLESPDKKGHILRIGLLFPKGKSQIGQFIASEFPYPQSAAKK